MIYLEFLTTYVGTQSAKYTLTENNSSQCTCIKTLAPFSPIIFLVTIYSCLSCTSEEIIRYYRGLSILDELVKALLQIKAIE